MEKYRDLPPMRGIVRMLQSLLGGGGVGRRMGLCEVYRDSQNLSSDPTFRPWHLTHSHSVGKRDLLWPTEYKGGSEVYKRSEKNIMVL